MSQSCALMDAILFESGYDQMTGLFLHPDPELKIKPIPENPTCGTNERCSSHS